MKLEVCICPTHKTYAIHINNARVTPEKCCEHWSTVKAWDVDPDRILRWAITENASGESEELFNGDCQQCGASYMAGKDCVSNVNGCIGGWDGENEN